VSKSALEAKAMGYLKEDDVIVFNPYELLHVAKVRRARCSTPATAPPLRRPVPVGRPLRLGDDPRQLVNMRDGGFISATTTSWRHDRRDRLGRRHRPGQRRVDEQWLLDMERKAFIELLNNPKTQERIMGMMQTGKPVRN
jgi:3-hydroxyacyl-CoA dehydrogenase